jgi:transmembrane sensor
VYTAEVTTRVLGTSFTIKARPGEKDVTVTVKTGKVSVYRHQGKTESTAALNETILTPNQKIIYDRQKDKVSRMLVEDPQTIVPAEEVKKLHFEDASVSEIFAALERVYGVAIVFDTKALYACTLTTSIAGGTIYNRLDMICKAIGTTYTVEETHIVIHGTGCN